MRYDAGDKVIEVDYWAFKCRVLNRVWLHKESIGKNWKGVGKSLVSQQQLQFDLGGLLLSTAAGGQLLAVTLLQRALVEADAEKTGPVQQRGSKQAKIPHHTLSHWVGEPQKTPHTLINVNFTLFLPAETHCGTFCCD